MRHGLVEYEATLVPDDGCFWRYELHDPKDTEAEYCRRTPTQSLTKLGHSHLLHTLDGRGVRKTVQE